MMKLSKITKKMTKVGIVGSVFTLWASTGFAASSGNAQLDSVATPLNQIMAFVEGPVVTILATAVIIGAGMFLMFNQGDNSSLVKKIAMIAIGVAVVALAPKLLSLFAFSGGCII